jgi:hypothetical protein
MMEKLCHKLAQCEVSLDGNMENYKTQLQSKLLWVGMQSGLDFATVPRRRMMAQAQAFNILITKLIVIYCY